MDIKRNDIADYINGYSIEDQDPETLKEELYEVENLICTPHIGGNSKEAVINMGLSAIKHLKDFKLKNQ